MAEDFRRQGHSFYPQAACFRAELDLRKCELAFSTQNASELVVSTDCRLKMTAETFKHILNSRNLRDLR